MRIIGSSHLIPREPNFMTPTRLGLWSIRRGATTHHIELSGGEGMDRKPIYGVTVRPDPDRLSKLCFSLTEAYEYIKELEQ